LASRTNCSASTTIELLFAVLRDERRSISALLFVAPFTVTISGSLIVARRGRDAARRRSQIP